MPLGEASVPKQEAGFCMGQRVLGQKDWFFRPVTKKGGYFLASSIEPGNINGAFLGKRKTKG